jgi:hypothetical protein
MTVINGIAYAEGNYPTWWWFWNYPLYLLSDWSALDLAKSNPYAWAGGAGGIERFDVGRWEQFLRCPCGIGFTPAKRAAVRDGKTASKTPSLENRWLCPDCGRDMGTLVKWIGRRTANRWEWKHESELPSDLRPQNESDKPPLETYEPGELDRRVRAAVEVEVAERMAAMEKKR